MSRIEKLINIKDLAKILACSEKKARRLCWEGWVNSFKLGKNVKIYADSVTEENLTAPKPKFKN